MPWVNDLASRMGIPAGAATLAVAMYLGCSAAERAARPEALAEIARILKDPSWSRSVRPSAIIERVFVWTFGERHLSWKCVARSLIASLVVIGGLGISLYLRSPTLWINMEINHFNGWWGIVMLLCLGVAPDYVSLAKARLILRMVDRSRSPAMFVVLVSSDIALSVTVSMLALFLTNAILYGYVSISRIIEVTGQSLARLDDLFSAYPLRVQIYELFLLSTFFTSIWTVLIVLSTTTLKLLAPVHRFTAWFFDVEKHPVQAIGIVAGALVMLGSLIWAVLRAVI